MFNFNDPQALYNFLINGAANYGTYEDFINLLYPQIDEIVSDMISSSEDFANANEDYISNKICSSLNDRKFNAVREARENGNADIRVKLGSFKWIAEAKRATSITNVREGLLQLLTRYSKGEGNATSGGLFIYIQGTDEREGIFMRKWINNELPKIHASTVIKIISTTPCSFKPTCYISNLIHPDSKNDYKLRHMPIGFFHNPKDKSARKSQKYKSE